MDLSNIREQNEFLIRIEITGSTMSLKSELALLVGKFTLIDFN